jgi:hypothetical protein
MGTPYDPGQFVRLQADDLLIYVSNDIWDKLKPRQSKLLVAVAGYGRYWLYLKPPLRAGQEEQCVD